MKRKPLLLTLFILANWMNGYSQQCRILFLGNSYTSVNDLPGTLSQLALSLGDSIYYDSNTPGGYTLQLHSNDATTLSKIAMSGWDYVIIQAQSQEPSFSPAQVATDTYPYARKLDSLVHVANPCAITLFYMTWGRKYGDASNCASYPPVCTFLGMNQRLRFSYLQMASDNFSRVAPAGMAWQNSWQSDSSINLWSGDNSHPSIAGTYLTANVFYASIYKQSTIGASYAGGLIGAQAAFLQNIGSSTVLDSLDTWLLNQNPIHADFSDTINLSQVEFYSNCYNASQFWWDFGDGIGYSSIENSGYYYNTTGTYQVELIASNGCYADTAFANVYITAIGIDEHSNQASYLSYPNPASSIIYLQGVNILNQPYQMIDLQGRVLQSGKLTNNSVDVSALTPGTYLFQIGGTTKKITIQ